VLDKLTSADFAPYLEQIFRIHLDQGEVLPVELITVTELGVKPASEMRQPYSIIFRGPRNVYLPQRIYTVEHDKLGTLELFLVPIGPDAVGMCFEAVFG
jgi:hypothetical protein